MPDTVLSVQHPCCPGTPHWLEHHSDPNETISSICCDKTCGLRVTTETFISAVTLHTVVSVCIDRRIRCLCAGLLADKLIKSGWSVTRVRKSLQTVAFLGPAVALIVLSRSKDPRLAVACMTCALGITSLGRYPLVSFHFMPYALQSGVWSQM